MELDLLMPTTALWQSDTGVTPLGLQMVSGRMGAACTGGSEVTQGAFCCIIFWLKKLRSDFSLFCGGSVLAVLFSLQVFESWCAFRLLILPVPTCTSALHSLQWSLLSAVNWLLFLQPRLAMVWSFIWLWTKVWLHIISKLSRRD